MPTETGHPIKIAVLRTGLSPHVIRVWEKRYAAVTPTRTPTNRRLYTDADIRRLRLLRQATLSGHSIGNIARLSTEQLVTMLAEEEAISTIPSVERAATASASESVGTYLEECLIAAEQLDATELESKLMTARVAFSQPVFLEQLIVPLMHHIGERWHDGSMRIMHEHLASSVVRTILGGLQEHAIQTLGDSPVLVVTTPSGQLHEIGALLAAATAVSDGWRIIYLGANLPAEEIAAAVQQKQARALALSIVHPMDDQRLEHELISLYRYLGQGFPILVGGCGAPAYKEVLKHIGATLLSDIQSLRTQLEKMRSLPPKHI